MSTPCSGCSASLDCPSDEAFPYTLTPLSPFPWVINCPEGVDCSAALSVTMNCCGSPTTIDIPSGTSAADRITLLNQLIQQCLFLENGCDDGGGGGEPDDPPTPPSATYYFSHAQTVNLECSNDGTYTLEIVAGSFMASTQQEADRLALAEVQKQARASKFCLYPPCLCVCADVAATLNMGISGGSGPFSYSILTGTLPTGLVITVIGGILRVAGTPTVAGNSSISLRVFDSVGGYLTKTLNFYILKITTTTLPNYETGVAYSQQIAATGGTGNYVFSISAGALPDGLSLSPSGLISGIPTGSSDATFTVAMLDSGLNQTSYCTKELTILASALQIDTQPDSQSVGYNVGSTLDMSVSASGGAGPLTYQWYRNGVALTDGIHSGGALGFYGVTGSTTDTLGLVIGGASTDITNPSLLVGSYHCIVTDANMNSVDSDVAYGYMLRLLNDGTAAGSTLYGGILWNGQAGEQYYNYHVIPGGLNIAPSRGVLSVKFELVSTMVGPFVWSIDSGVLPAGLSLEASVSNLCQLQGTPAAAETANFVVKCTDSNGAEAFRTSEMDVVTKLSLDDVATMVANFNADCDGVLLPCTSLESGGSYYGGAGQLYMSMFYGKTGFGFPVYVGCYIFATGGTHRLDFRDTTVTGIVWQCSTAGPTGSYPVLTSGFLAPTPPDPTTIS